MARSHLGKVQELNTDSSSEGESVRTDSTVISEDDSAGPFRALKPEALIIILAAYARSRSPGAKDANESSSVGPAQHNPSSTGAQSSTYHPTRNRKRAHEDGEEDGEKNGKARRKGETSTPAAELRPLFACPFYKFDPHKHRSCSTKVLRSSARVK